MFRRYTLALMVLVVSASASTAERFQGTSNSLTPCEIRVYKDFQGNVVQAEVDNIRQVFVLGEETTAYGYSVLTGSIKWNNLIYSVTIYMNGDSISRYELDAYYHDSRHLFSAKTCFDLQK